MSFGVLCLLIVFIMIILPFLILKFIVFIDSYEEDKYNNYLKSKGFDRFQTETDFDIQHEGESDEQRSDKYFDFSNSVNEQELTLCNEFLSRNPKNLYAIFQRAFLYSWFEQYENAIQDYKYLIQKKPKDFHYVKSCAGMYAHLNDSNQAFNLIKSFYKDKQPDAKYYSAFGYIYQILGDFELAVKNYTEAIKIEPDNSTYYLDRALVYRQLGNEDAYNSDMNKHRELKNKVREMIQNKSIALEK